MLYVVSGIVLSLYFSVRGLHYRAVDLFFRPRFRDQNCEIAIHGKIPRYEITFLPVIDALQERGLDVTRFTMYERDETFPSLPGRVAHRAIPPGMVGYAYLNNLEAVLLVTTTPQLDVMTFRRSRRVRHYTIVSHALGESRYAPALRVRLLRFRTVLRADPQGQHPQDGRHSQTAGEATPRDRHSALGRPHAAGARVGTARSAAGRAGRAELGSPGVCSRRSARASWRRSRSATRSLSGRIRR